MFAYCDSLTSLDISSFNTSSVIDMTRMFANCKSLTSLDISGFDLKKLISYGNILTSCMSLKRFVAPYTSGTNKISIAVIFIFNDSNIAITLKKLRYGKRSY
jgi:surface protein